MLGAGVTLIALCAGFVGMAFWGVMRDISLRARWGDARARVQRMGGSRHLATATHMTGDSISTLCQTIANGLRCGQGLLQSLSVAAKEVEGPAGEATADALKQFAAGVPLCEALSAAERRLHNRDFGQIVRAIQVFQETGGDASEALLQVARAARERDEMKAILSSRTADAQVSSVIVAVIPFVLGILSYTAQPAVFIYAARAAEGRFALALGLGLWMSGTYLAWRITHPGWL